MNLNSEMFSLQAERQTTTSFSLLPFISRKYNKASDCVK